MKKTFVLFTALVCAIFAGIFVLKTTCEPAEPPQKNSEAPEVAQQFGRAVKMIQNVCTKNPSGKINTLLQGSGLLQTNIDANAIICISKKLEKDTEIKKASEKIAKKINKKPELIKKCFVHKDPESFPKFEKLLRNTTLKCGGLGFLWGKGETYQAAAFVAAAKCLECHTPPCSPGDSGQ